MNVEFAEPEPSTALTVTARAALALKSAQVREKLKALVAKSVNIGEIKNPAGRAECHSAAMVLADERIDITKTGKAARDDAVKFGKAVIAEEAALIAITEPEEKRLLALRDAWDAARAAEKAAKELAERNRITAIHTRIADIKGFVALALECRTAERVQSLIDKLAAKIDQEHYAFDEFANEAQAAFDATHAKLLEILAAKQAEEAERVRVKAEQEAQAAALKAEREALDALRVEQEMFALHAATQRARDEAEAQAKREAEAAELARQRAEIEAEIAARREAEAAAEKVRREAEEADMAARREALAKEAADLAAAKAAHEAEQAQARQAKTERLADQARREDQANLAARRFCDMELSQEQPAATDETPTARPSDAEIVAALCAAFGAMPSEVVQWLVDFDPTN